MVNRRFVIRVIGKSILFFIVFNLIYILVQPLNLLDHLSVYNVLVPGRTRLPFADFPTESYNISLGRIDEMLATHVIAKPKGEDEYRVVMLGDSSVWGYLLQSDQAQAACLNNMAISLPSGRKVKFYNLGYPILSVTKDMLILRHALAYQPDLIVWSTTLASLYPSDQLDFPIIKLQGSELTALTAQYHFRFYQPLPLPRWFDGTFFGQRTMIANWLREQLYGLSWAATGIDHQIDRFVQPHPTDLVPNDDIVTVGMMHLATQYQISPEDLSFDVMGAGIEMAKANNPSVPVLLINEPIYHAGSDLRWDFYYPRWAYDTYRQAFQTIANRNGWQYVDLWDAVPNDQFSDTDLHLTAPASCTFAQKLRDQVLALAQ